MFNDDQSSHTQYLRSLPAELKCGCGWYAKWDCYRCTLGDLVRHGGKVEEDWKGTRLFLPSGVEVDYTKLREWLREEEKMSKESVTQQGSAPHPVSNTKDEC